MNFNKIIPKKIVNTAAVFKRVNFSFKNNDPIKSAKMILVSLKAETIGIGAWVNPHTTIA